MIEPLSYYIDGINNKDRIVLSRAITLIESTVPAHRVVANQLIEYCLKQEKQSKRIGITGSPGVGKSTFINALGAEIIANSQSLAILAIDPSSTITKGSILGDKTRMYEIAYHKDVFIRPTASSNYLGGIAQNTYQTILLCEAFGFDYILIETVGVGQSEIEIKHLTDLFMLLVLPNSGDELQGIKRGVMELADIIIINKADKANEQQAKISVAQLKSVLPLLNYQNKEWNNIVLQTSSIEKMGIDNVLKYIEGYFSKVNIESIRKQQILSWKNNLVIQLIQEKIMSNKNIKTIIDEFLANDAYSYKQIQKINTQLESLINKLDS